MTTTPRYLLAKYIPDMLRYEPKNIGVIVWSPETISARFLGERIGSPGDIDGRSIPSFVASLPAYRQWIGYWRAVIEKDQLPLRGGLLVPRTSPDFLDVLMSSSKGEFLLTDGGFLLDEVPAGEMPQLVSHLFSTLVELPAEDPKDDRLDEICARIIREADLIRDPNFRRGYELECPITTPPRLALFEAFKFTYAYRNGVIKGLYQQVPLSRTKGTMKRTVHHSAWMFEKVIGADIVTREKAAALVYAPAERLADREVRNSIEVLSSVARVINVAQPDEALGEFRRLPS